MWWDYLLPGALAIGALALVIFVFPRWRGGL